MAEYSHVVSLLQWLTWSSRGWCWVSGPPDSGSDPPCTEGWCTRLCPSTAVATPSDSAHETWGQTTRTRQWQCSQQLYDAGETSAGFLGIHSVAFNGCMNHTALTRLPNWNHGTEYLLSVFTITNTHDGWLKVHKNPFQIHSWFIRAGANRDIRSNIFTWIYTKSPWGSAPC